MNRFQVSVGAAVFVLSLSGCVDGKVSFPRGSADAPLQIRSMQQVDLIVALDPERMGCREKKPQENQTDSETAPSQTGATLPKGAALPESKDMKGADTDTVLKCVDGKTAEPTSTTFEAVASSLGLGRPGPYDPDKKRAEEANDRDLNLVRQRLETAFIGFYKYKPSSDLKLRRNAIADRLIGASDLNCIEFKKNLYAGQAETNLWLGGAATGVTGAGAIVTQASPARILSGIGAILIGLRGEINEDLYRKTYVEAISKAIDNRRESLRDKMKGKYTSDLDLYSVEAAVADALRYNNACSLVEGLAEISHSVEIADDPIGVRALRSQLARAGYDVNISLEKSTNLPLDGVGGSAPVGLETAQAKIADGQIRAWMAHLQTVANASKSRLNILKKDPNGIDKEVATLIDSADPSKLALGSLAEAYQQQLNGLTSSYDNLVTRLATSKSEDEQAQITQLMRANDRNAAAILSSFRDLFEQAERKISSIEKVAPPKAS